MRKINQLKVFTESRTAIPQWYPLSFKHIEQGFHLPPIHFFYYYYFHVIWFKVTLRGKYHFVYPTNNLLFSYHNITVCIDFKSPSTGTSANVVRRRTFVFHIEAFAPGVDLNF